MVLRGFFSFSDGKRIETKLMNKAKVKKGGRKLRRGRCLVHPFPPAPAAIPVRTGVEMDQVYADTDFPPRLKNKTPKVEELFPATEGVCSVCGGPMVQMAPHIVGCRKELKLVTRVKNWTASYNATQPVMLTVNRELGALVDYVRARILWNIFQGTNRGLK